MTRQLIACDLPLSAARYYAANRAAACRARLANIFAAWVFALAVTAMFTGALLESPVGCRADIRLPLTNAVCIAMGR